MKGCRYLIVLLTVAAMASCKQKDGGTAGDSSAEPIVADTTDHAIAPEQLINPGKSIGHMALEGNLDSIENLMGRPDKQDAAMGSALLTWYADHDTTGYKTSVFAHRNMGGKDEQVQYIKKILVTSPWFKTAEYISTGNTKKDIEKYYSLKQGKSYTANGKTIEVYTDLARGITFEIDPINNTCVSILVHKPNDTADTYINMH